MKLIQSRDNPQFKELARIASSARYRAKAQQTLLDGAHLLASCLDRGLHPRQLFLNSAGTHDSEIRALTVRATETPVTQLDDRLFSDVSDLKTPSGVIALIDLPSPEVRVRDTNFILLLEDIQDPGNLGSMLRTAAAAGCDAVFLSENCVDAWSPKVLRAAMGGHFVLQIFERQSLIDVVAEFRGELYATSLRSERSLYDCRFQGNLGFLVGNEGAGLSNALLDRVSQVIKIPMCGALESLNVAAATAICLFEATRQRHQQN